MNLFSITSFQSTLSFSTEGAHSKTEQAKERFAAGNESTAVSKRQAITSAETVEISPEAKAKASKEQIQTESLDRLIAETKENIATLNRELKKLRLKNDDLSQTQLKAKQGQMIGLNVQLMQLYSKKMDMLEG